MEQSGLDLDDLRAFFLVAETGSFSKAAHRLDSSKSIVSRRVARLESVLSAQLLQRTVRGTQMTDAGQLYYEQARAALSQLECAADALNESVSDISGSIRLTGPLYFGSRYLVPALCDFMQLYPRIELEISLNDEKIDIAREGVDIAVRTGHLPDSSLNYRPLCQSRRLLAASPAYLGTHAPIVTPDDIAGHRLLHYSSLNTQDLWRYTRDGEQHHLKITPHLRSNSGTMLLSAAAAGQGLVLLPAYVLGPALQTGELVEVLGEVDWGQSPISLLTSSGRSATKRVRVLLDFLCLRFSNWIV